MLELVKYVLWHESDQYSLPAVAQSDYEEIKKHALAALFIPVIPMLNISSELKELWKKDILELIAHNANCRYMQSTMPITVPYVVLKGTSAAQYYPHPNYRAMGDIDIMTRREDLDKVRQELLDAGYIVVKNTDREIGFANNNVMIELHRYFSLMNNAAQAKYLDDLIISNINPSHVLPDDVNGLVLLEHINQHLEGGIGLRHIIDWMMFVDKCMPDKKWPDFQSMVKRIGLETLAIVVTQMCVEYLGLPARKWCANADKTRCRQLMNYVLSCGNFGNKRDSDSDIGEAFFFRSRNPKALFRLLQARGLVNWELAQKYKPLRSFAWLYQLVRYGWRGIGRKNALRELKNEHKAAKQRQELFDALGIKQTSDGHITYENGKYIHR